MADVVTDLDLGAWQQRLDTHFTELAARRKVTFPERPIFALEHGLDQTETDSLFAALRLQITKNTPTRDHSLTWVVYASEIGYRYSGDEYWQTFEADTPGWVLHGDRYWLRSCFLSFCKKYGGAEPSGRWAEHFSIICWPITHAILPRDLQRQLARILYELRHSYSKHLFESPSELGELIASRSWTATSRFQNFVQETALVGQIATALLLEGESGTPTRIEPRTLQRIGADLDRERRGRDWLRSARRFAKKGASVRVFGGQRARATPALKPEEARAELARVGIEPHLALYPLEVSENRWSVYCEIPDLSGLMLRFPEFREVLMGSRCLVAGAAGTPLARGRCLYGVQRVRLTRWPKAEEVLLQFEKSTPALDYLLRTECLLRPGPLWLFHVGFDGIAPELRSLRVRPGHRYILLSTERPFDAKGHVRPIELDCSGAYATLVSLPAALTHDWEETLRGFGLQQAKTIEIWPVGLAPVAWDAEAAGEWLPTDRPCFAIRPDHPLDLLSLSIQGADGHSQFELRSLAAGDPIFVELPVLPIGVHKLDVTALSTDEDKARSEIQVTMRIREPRPLRLGLNPSGPLLVHLDPPSPTLEQLWEGELDMTISGPVGRQVTCCIALHEAEDASPIFQKKLPPLELPVSPTAWRDHCDKHFRHDKGAQQVFDDARMCCVNVSASELGGFQLRCDREFKPLRWSIRRAGLARVVRLIDDSPGDVKPSVIRIAFDKPANQTTIDFGRDYEPPSSGGLFVARKGTYTAAVVAPPTIHDFRDLRFSPTITTTQRNPDAVMQTLQVTALWTHAKLPGDVVSAIRRQEILLALAHHIAELICGGNWAKAETLARASDRRFKELREAISKAPNNASLANRLDEFSTAFLMAPTEKRVAGFASVVSEFGLTAAEDDLLWMSELALRLASDPGNVETWGGAPVREGVKCLMEAATTLARSARFVVLSIDHMLESEKLPSQLYQGWLWR